MSAARRAGGECFDGVDRRKFVAVQRRGGTQPVRPRHSRTQDRRQIHVVARHDAMQEHLQLGAEQIEQGGDRQHTISGLIGTSHARPNPSVTPCPSTSSRICMR